MEFYPHISYFIPPYPIFTEYLDRNKTKIPEIYSKFVPDILSEHLGEIVNNSIEPTKIDLRGKTMTRNRPRYNNVQPVLHAGKSTTRDYIITILRAHVGGPSHDTLKRVPTANHSPLMLPIFV